MLYDKDYYESTKKYASNEGRIGKIYKSIMLHKPKMILDVGCGMGHLVKMFLDNGVGAIGLDVSPDAGELIPNNFVVWDARKRFPFEDKSFDVCISKDFFEHLKEDEIDFTYKEMQRVAKEVLAVISFKYDREYGMHETIKGYGWWLEKLPGCQILL